ncbi:ADP-ribosylglycohydrolase family protein [Magnetovibrio sp. PR-2]|uniref:ADP-ribosylglycohydrolase family protein n=1 Tax=Magnetovibrio sp. PR-2 TaxID=3120356 RepID=UPI002FCE258D
MDHHTAARAFRAMEGRMLGAIAGDIIGSIYEYSAVPADGFPLFKDTSTFTDDTVLTIAVADWILSGGSIESHLRRWARRYPDAGYGGRFKVWMLDDKAEPLNSYGNGSAMRVSPIGWCAKTPKDALQLARKSAKPTHGHPDGIAGAQAVALAMCMAQNAKSISDIRAEIEKRFGYDLSTTVAQIRKDYGYDITCKGSVPQALVCALEADSYEQTIRNAISLGGDADTIACMAGGLSEILHGMPKAIKAEALARLDKDLRGVVKKFESCFVSPSLVGRARRLLKFS